MKTVKEKYDDDIFVDLILNKEDLELIKDEIVISDFVRINGKTLNIGIRIATPFEEKEDAIEEEP